MKDDLLTADDGEPPSSSLPIAHRSLLLSSAGTIEISQPQPALTKPLIPQPRRRPVAAFVIAERSDSFRRRFFPQAGRRDWNDWRWQNSNRVRSADELARIIRLSDDEQAAIHRHRGSLPLAIAPYYASLLDADNPAQGLRRTVVPANAEYLHTNGESDDPLGEDDTSPVPGLVHRYPDRVLLLATGICSTYCRYCTRSRLVGATGERSIKKSYLEQAISYIENNPLVRDVLVSGGDPLSLDDEKLDWLLGRLRNIPHLEFLRIGTKMPAVLPQRITPALVKVLKKHKPWMSIHFTHADELTPEVAEACARLADAGLPLGSQTVLLKGVNDDIEAMKQLLHGLLKIRVKPYYLYQCDPISGSAHFRTTVDKGLEIIRGLRGHTSGYAVPTFVVDAPAGGGKIPLLPDYIAGRDGDDLLLSNYTGRIYRYTDPEGRLGMAQMHQEVPLCV
jgi:lysine 2,3-aminomutase